MNRKNEVLRFVSKDQFGLEIAPNFNPLAAKKEGFNCESIDISDAGKIRQYIAEDPRRSDEDLSRIEDVDYVLDACQIDNLRHQSSRFGSYDYIVSSHNFEHLANPIKFLQGAYDALAPGGHLSMAIPDYRACFDYFRFPTRLSDWLQAFHNDDEKPTTFSIFDYKLNVVKMLDKKQRQQNAFALCREYRVNFEPMYSPKEVYKEFLESGDSYHDNHCSVLCPEVFHLLMADAIEIGLVKFQIRSISITHFSEFYVHLRKPLSEGERIEENRLNLLTEAKRAICVPLLFASDRLICMA